MHVYGASAHLPAQGIISKTNSYVYLLRFRIFCPLRASLETHFDLFWALVAELLSVGFWRLIIQMACPDSQSRQPIQMATPDGHSRWSLQVATLHVQSRWPVQMTNPNGQVGFANPNSQLRCMVVGRQRWLRSSKTRDLERGGR